jgi:hypothetical protein
MSMNLHVESNKSEKPFDLLQTPTTMSYLIYSDGDGGPDRIMHRYTIWVESLVDGVYTDEKELKDKRTRIKKHLNALKTFKKEIEAQGEQLSFFIM